MAADIMVDPNLVRPSLSLKEMNLLPYILVYDAATGLPADISKFNEDGSSSLNFQKFGELHFLYDGTDEARHKQMSVRDCI